MLCLKRVCVCFVFEVCVGVVPRMCEAMEAASAPAGKPPAKRLGKQIYVSISQNIIHIYHLYIIRFFTIVLAFQDSILGVFKTLQALTRLTERFRS